MRRLTTGMCRIAIVFLLVTLHFPARADAPEVGLLWNRTGLPATFPLTVLAQPAEQYLVTLFDAETGAPALAAVIEGGAFPRILVPPGHYRVLLEKGQAWHGAERGFGQSVTVRIALPGPLRFSVKDTGTRGGHLIDLRALDADGNGSVTLRVDDQCVRRRLIRAPRPQAPFNDVDGFATRLPADGEIVRHPDARFDPDRLRGVDRPTIPTDHAPYFSHPRFGNRPAPC